jgi:hypothetical protein
MMMNYLLQVAFRRNGQRVAHDVERPESDHSNIDVHKEQQPKKSHKKDRKHRKIEHYPGALTGGETKKYGDPEYEAKRNFHGHRNQGYFSRKTKVADDKMYQR